MSPDGLIDSIRQKTEDEADAILGELARLMSPALRTRAEQVADISGKLGLQVPDPIAWILGLGSPSVEAPEVTSKPVVEPATTSVRGGGPKERAHRAKIRESAVVAALTDKPLRWTDIQAATGLPNASLSDALASLVKQGRIRKHDGSGLYLLPSQAVKETDSGPVPVREVGSRGTYTTRSGEVRSKPSHPGIEGVPEHLRHLPAAQAGGPLTQRVKTAELQQQVLEDALSHPTVISNEVTDRLTDRLDRPIRNELTAKHLTALSEAGLLRRTGKNRRKPGVVLGKASIEYAAPEEKVPPTTPVPPHGSDRDVTDIEPASGPADGNGDTQLYSKVRDYAVAQVRSGPFTPLKCATALGVSVEVAQSMLSRLAERDIVKDMSVPGMTVFEYQKPTSMGQAATLDRQRAKALSAAESSVPGGGGEAVAGSGWDVKSFSSDPNVRAVLRIVAAQWGKESILPKRGNQHIMIRTPDGTLVSMGSTPSVTSLRADKRKLKSAGLKGV